MHLFTEKNGKLFAEDIPLSTLAERYGTPLFVYSEGTLERHASSIDGAFHEIDHLTCYSVKANSNGTILQLLARHGLGADIVSGGELFRALRAGIPPERIVFSGVGKTESEIRSALESKILMFNIESESELEKINQIAGNMHMRAPIAFRVNPDIDPKTHPYISTGLRKNKFGIPHDDILRLYKKAHGMAHCDVIGIDAHIGSQLLDTSPFREEAQRLVDLMKEIRRSGIDLRIVDIGGGLGINYEEKFPPDPADWANVVVPILKDTGCRLIIEPGRSLVGNTGIIVTRVLYIKSTADKTFIVVDAAMNDLARPSLYGSYHTINPCNNRHGEKRIVDVVGPICESGDFIAKDRELPLPKEGDFLAIMSAGAYGMSMSSNYNSRPRAAEVMVKRSEVKLVTRRETYDDLISREI